MQVLHPLQQRFLNLINQENFAQISQEEAVKQEIVATLEALCGIAEATQIDNVASLFSFLMDFLSSCIGLMEVRTSPGRRITVSVQNDVRVWCVDFSLFKSHFVVFVVFFRCSGVQQHAGDHQPDH